MSKVTGLFIIAYALCMLYVKQANAAVNNIEQSIVAPVMANGVPSELLKADAPSKYCITSHDTVISIANKYLTKISYWSALTGIDDLTNSALHVGDCLTLYGEDNKTLMRVNINTYSKLKPQIEDITQQSVDQSALIPLYNLLPNLKVSLAPSTDAPAVIASPNINNDSFTAGDVIYVKGLRKGHIGEQIAIFSTMSHVIDPDSQEDLGIKIRYNGEGTLLERGIISSILLTETMYYVQIGDIVLSNPPIVKTAVLPHQSNIIITGKIVSLESSKHFAANEETVLINRGSRDGVTVGDVFDILDSRQRVVNPLVTRQKINYSLLPIEIIGEAVVYEVNDKASFALITAAKLPIGINETIQTQQ